MSIKIVEKKPGGKGSFKEIFEKLDRAESRSSDMRAIFKTLVPKIVEAERYAFSDANPTGWPMLDSAYRAWKIKQGYPGTIGIQTGALKQAVTDKAIVNVGRRKLTYRLNPSVRQTPKTATKRTRHRKVGEYAHYFDAGIVGRGQKKGERRIFEYALEYINDFTKRAAKEYIRRGFEQ